MTIAAYSSETQPADASDITLFSSLLDLNHDTKGRLVRYKAQYNEFLPRLLNQFYEMVTDTPQLRRRLPSQSIIPHLKQAQTMHWNHLFDGHLDQDYLSRVDRIAHSHYRIGLDSGWFMTTYLIIGLKMVEACFAHYEAQLTALQPQPSDNDTTTSADASPPALSDEVALLTAAKDSVVSFLKILFLDASLITKKYNETSLLGFQDKLDGMINHQTGVIKQALSETTNEALVVTSSVTEMAACLRELSSNTNTTLDVSRETCQLTETAQGAIDHLRRTSEEINAVIQLISEVAEKTKVLALNAAIQAAHAGDAGKGFQVVANAVKSLSLESMASTKEVSAKVRDVQQQVHQVANNIRHIRQRMDHLSTCNESLASAIEEQSTAMEAITQSMVVVSNSTTQVQDSVQQLEENSNQLRQEITSL